MCLDLGVQNLDRNCNQTKKKIVFRVVFFFNGGSKAGHMTCEV